ncbi:MAG: hypothetical protein ACOYXB_06545 [Bacteroidota bacterium]
MESYDEIIYEERLVAFIDILGFKEVVKKSERNADTRKLIYDSLVFLKKREYASNWDLQLIEIEEDAQKRNLEDFDISNRTACTSFSDSIAVSVGYDKSTINETLSTLIANLSLVGARLMTKGILFRGGITTGRTIHLDNGIIFGQGLIDAYELESKAASFPRILLSDKLLKLLNYPITTKRDRYPYHQYIKRFSDGCVGFHQMIYFEVLQSWKKMSERRLKIGLTRVKKTIINGLDNSFENPNIYNKYLWLKNEYDKLYIDDKIKPRLYNLNEDIAGQNIHYSYTDDFYESKKTSH